MYISLTLVMIVYLDKYYNPIKLYYSISIAYQNIKEYRKHVTVISVLILYLENNGNWIHTDMNVIMIILLLKFRLHNNNI